MAATMASANLMEIPSSDQGTEDLVRKLDHLFEQYLNTLDQYQKARQDLSSILSSGHISLAQANFSNSSRRYGQDYYDERMQAQWMVRASTSTDHDNTINFACVKAEQEPIDTTSGNTGDNVASSKVEEAKPEPKDPLRWFGVLVPPSLRSAQASFSSAVTGPIPDLVTLQQQLRNLEIEIGRTRKMMKKIGKV